MNNMAINGQGMVYNIPEGQICKGRINGIEEEFVKFFNTSRGNKTFVLRKEEDKHGIHEAIYLISGDTYVEYTIWK